MGVERSQFLPRMFCGLVLLLAERQLIYLLTAYGNFLSRLHGLRGGHFLPITILARSQTSHRTRYHRAPAAYGSQRCSGQRGLRLDPAPGQQQAVDRHWRIGVHGFLPDFELHERRRHLLGIYLPGADTCGGGR